jgi:hypothetical protein
MPASADDIARSIEPGSTEYGDRQVVSDRIQQIVGQAQAPARPTPGAASSRAQDRLAGGPVSDLPVTDGLSVGPGAGPTQAPVIANTPRVEQLRVVAANARSPRLRALARDLLRAEAKKA